MLRDQCLYNLYNNEIFVFRWMCQICIYWIWVWYFFLKNMLSRKMLFFIWFLEFWLDFLKNWNFKFVDFWTNFGWFYYVFSISSSITFLMTKVQKSVDFTGYFEDLDKFGQKGWFLSWRVGGVAIGKTKMLVPTNSF